MKIRKTYLLCLLAILLSVLLFPSCDSSSDSSSDSAPAPATVYTCDSCVDSPEALAINDNSYKGVYKGVITGSAGTFAVYVENGDTAVTLKWEFEGSTGEITGTQTGTDPYEYTFNLLGLIEFVLTVDSDGTNVSATFTYDGEVKVVTIMKEISDSLVKCYKGTYTGSSNCSGVWNIVDDGTNVAGSFNLLSDAQCLPEGTANGTITGSSIIFETKTGTYSTPSGTFPYTFSVNGLFNDDSVTGSWTFNLGPDLHIDTGTWEGDRYR